MKKILIATTNSGKVREYSEFLKGLNVHCLSLKDVGIVTEVEETGTTYKENAILKALTYAKESGLPSLSDDGGLEISALGGRPGLHSRRWVGGTGRDEDIVKKMIEVSKQLPENNRHATFKIVIAFALSNGNVWTKAGSVPGVIAQKPLMKLLKGYPYRSFLYLPKLKKYYHESELTLEEEKKYNHRYKAVQKLLPIIQNVILSEAKESH